MQNFGGRTHISDIEFANNTIVNRNAVSESGGGLMYLPTDVNETDGRGNPVNGPLGNVTFRDNIVYDQRSYNVDRASISIGTYQSDALYAEVVDQGKLTLEQNVYFNPNEELRFNLFNANYLPYEPRGGAYDLASWQALGFDRGSVAADPDFDEVFLPGDSAAIEAGWYAAESPRLTVFSASHQGVTEGETTKVYVVRSGDGIDLNRPLTVTVTPSDDSELEFSTQVTIPAGRHKAAIDIHAISDGELDGERAVRLSAAAEAFGDNVSAWLRVSDDGRAGEPDMESVDLAAYEVRLRGRDGKPLYSVSPGAIFYVDVFVRDTRAAADREGVFSAFVDLTVDRPDLITAHASSLSHGASFPNATSGAIGDANLLVDEGGGVGSPAAGDFAEQLLFSIQLTAGDESGLIRFDLNQADVPLLHDTLLFGESEPVPNEQLRFGSAQVLIESCAANDVDCDGHVTTTDAQLVLDRLNNPSTPDNPYFDVNGDGVVSPLDALLVINELLFASPAGTEAAEVPLSADSRENPLGSRTAAPISFQRGDEMIGPQAVFAQRPARLVRENDVHIMAVEALDESYLVDDDILRLLADAPGRRG